MTTKHSATAVAVRLSIEHGGDERGPAGQLGVGQEALDHPTVSVLTHLTEVLVARLQQLREPIRERRQVGGIREKHPGDPVADLIGDAPHRFPMTGRPLYIASATVRPKPSAMLFWTTTVACR